MKKINLMNSNRLLFLNIALILGAFLTLAYSSHWTTTTSDCSGNKTTTYHNSKDYGKAVAETEGNGSVSVSGTNSTSASTNSTGTTAGTQSYVTWNCGLSSDGQSTTLSAVHENKVTFTASPAEGYTFEKWVDAKGNTVSTTATYTTTITIPCTSYGTSESSTYQSSSSPYTVTYKAYFIEKKEAAITMTAAEGGTYTYSYNGKNGTVSNANVGIKTGDDVTFTATANPNYKFFGWYTLNGTDEEYISYAATLTKAFTADATIYAKFLPSNAAIFSVKNGDGTPYYDLNKANTAAANSSSKTIILSTTGTAVTGEYTISKGVTLIVPFDADATTYTDKPGYTTTYSTPSTNAYRKLTLNSGTTITVNGNLSIPAKQTLAMGYNGSPTGAYGQIVLEDGSSIILNSGANLYAYGYITGSGSVVAQSGSRVYEDYQMPDYRGGNALYSMVNNSQKVFPMSQYFIQNVEAPFTIYSGANVLCSTGCYPSSKEVQVGGIKFIASDGMFILSSGSMTRTYDPVKDRMSYKLDGNATLNKIQMDLTFTYYIDFNCSVNSADYVLPFNNNMSVEVTKDHTFTIANEAELLPGCELKVDEGAFLSISKDKSLYVYDGTEWNGKGFAYGGPNIRPVPFTPTRTTTPNKSAAQPDASIVVDGTLTVNGYLRTTASGANINTVTGKGQVVMNSIGSAGTTYQATQADTKISYSDISYTPAQLLNGDGKTYYATSNISAGKTVTYKNNQWGWLHYTVKYNANGGTGTMADQNFLDDNAQNLTANAFTNSNKYTVTYNYNGNGQTNTTAESTMSFGGWATTSDGAVAYTDGQSVSDLSTTDGATVDLYAHWNASAVTLPTPTRTGYTFAGWYDANNNNKVGDGGASYTPSANVTLTAHWTAIQSIVSFDANGGDKIETTSTVTYDGTYGTLPTPTRTGYTFDGWYTDKTDGTQVTKDTKVMITAAQTLYAHWTANKYTISFDAGEGTGTAMANQTLTYDKEEALSENTYTGPAVTASFNAGYDGAAAIDSKTANREFKDWSDGKGNTYTAKQEVKNLASTKDANVALTAEWNDVTVTLPAALTRSKYVFAGWNDGATTHNANTSVDINKNTAYTAQWTPKQWVAQWVIGEDNTATILNTSTAQNDMPTNAGAYSITTDQTPAGQTFVGWKAMGETAENDTYRIVIFKALFVATPVEESASTPSVSADVSVDKNTDAITVSATNTNEAAGIVFTVEQVAEKVANQVAEEQKTNSAFATATVNLSNNEQVYKKDESTETYRVATDVEIRKAVVDKTKNENTIVILPNKTTVSSTTDATTGETVYTPNVITKTENASGKTELVCKNLIITDNTATGKVNEFQAPETFTADKVSYERTSSSTWGTICMPYVLKNGDFGVNYYLFDGADETSGKVNFVPLGENEELPANKPALYHQSTGVVSITKTNTEIEALSNSLTNSHEGSEWYMVGTYKQEKLTSKGDNEDRYYISKNTFWKVSQANQGYVILNPFRAYFTTTNPNAAAPSRLSINIVDRVTGTVTCIGELDANGNIQESSKFIQNGRLYIRKNGQVFDAQGKLVK